MYKVKRKVTYRLYPTGNQKEKLLALFELHRTLYNAALEQRIDAYRRCGVSLSFSRQCRELTELRRDNIDYREINAQSAQVTLKRLDLGFGHFFRRVRGGETKAGFPRFKGRERFSGWGYKTHGDGWRLKGCENGKMRVSGVGEIRIRGRGRFKGNAKTVEINRKGERWYASVTFTLKKLPLRKRGTKAIGIDWGLMQFAKVVEDDGTVREIENPRTLSNSLKQLKQAQKKLSRKKKGSGNRKRARKKVARIHEKVSNQRKNFLHQTSCQLVEQSSLICTEQLNVKEMTKNGGAYKRGLNRSILDTSPGTFLAMLRYKAEEAGIEYREAPTRKLKPSQTCSCCGNQEKKQLSERVHECKHCGLVLDRDENAAWVLLNWGLYGNPTGREPAWCGEGALVSSVKHETSPAGLPQVV